MDAEDRAPTRYVHAWVDLRDDGEAQAIVYLKAPLWCGSGGCVMLVLEPTNTTFRIVGKTSIIHTPIRVLAHVTNGWHDIGVRVEGGGVLSSYEAALSFSGRTYPGNPSVPPARRLDSAEVGAIVISGNEPAELLYLR